MPATVLTTGPTLTDQQADAALAELPPLPHNVLVALRHLQAQVTDQEARIEALEAAS